MKTLKKINLTFLAILLGFGLVFTQSAFKAPKPTTNSFAYGGLTNDMGEFKTAVWTLDNGHAINCVSPDEIVCHIDFDGDRADLQDFLDNPSTTAPIVIVKASDFKE